MKLLADCRLYTFIDTAYLRGRRPADVAAQLCDGGSDLIQLRAKDSTPDEVRRLAQEIQPVLQSAQVGFVLNDYWDIACEVGADFCHLGQEDFFDAGWTDSSQLQLPPGISEAPLLGLSTHTPAQAARAVRANPAYVAIGPIYQTPTKPSASPVTLEYVRWAAAHIQIPWFAIGGINLHNLDEVLQAGATRICVVSAILNTPDPAETCREFLRLLRG